MAALFVALFSIYWVETKDGLADATLVRAYESRAELLMYNVAMLGADSAAHAYDATRQSQFLTEFAAAKTRADASLDRLRRLNGDDPASASVLRQLGALWSEQFGLLTRLPEALGAERSEALDRLQALRGEAQSCFRILDAAQNLTVFRSQYQRDAARQMLFRVVVVCGIIGPLGALFVHLLLTGRLVRRIQAVAANARRLAHGVPLKPIPPGTDEISELSEQLEYSAGLLGERETKLRESARRYRELFDQAPIPYEETGADGMIQRFNQAVCTLLKCAPDRILGCAAWEFVAPERRESFREAMLLRIAEGIDSGPFECEYVLDDGSNIFVEIRENLIRDERGEITGLCRSLVDVTERNLAAVAAAKVTQYAMELRKRNEQLAQALEAARAATAAKSRFLAGVSHELRTPLNGIIGFSELLHDGRVGETTEEQRECLGDILMSARHLLALINEILDLSKVEAGKMEFRPERCDIEALVDEVRAVIWPLADKKRIRLSVEGPPGFTAVTDPSRFKQILYNYLSNAVKFTHEGGSVIVRVARENDARFRVDVEDTGVGIAPEEIPQLFSEFQQLASNRKAEQGTGLGLALTRRIVEAQGGEVAVRSVPGQGSVFSAVLPLDPFADSV